MNVKNKKHNKIVIGKTYQSIINFDNTTRIYDIHDESQQYKEHVV